MPFVIMFSRLLPKFAFRGIFRESNANGILFIALVTFTTYFFWSFILLQMSVHSFHYLFADVSPPEALNNAGVIIGEEIFLCRSEHQLQKLFTPESPFPKFILDSLLFHFFSWAYEACCWLSSLGSFHNEFLEQKCAARKNRKTTNKKKIFHLCQWAEAVGVIPLPFPRKY